MLERVQRRATKMIQKLRNISYEMHLKFSFSHRTVNEWNRLSADCVGASSVNIFKNKIDIYLRRAGYT